MEAAGQGFWLHARAGHLLSPRRSPGDQGAQASLFQESRGQRDLGQADAPEGSKDPLPSSYRPPDRTQGPGQAS